MAVFNGCHDDIGGVKDDNTAVSITLLDITMAFFVLACILITGGLGNAFTVSAAS
jgi:hypothetical protein